MNPARKRGAILFGIALAFGLGTYTGYQWRVQRETRGRNDARPAEDPGIAALREEKRRLLEQIAQSRTGALAPRESTTERNAGAGNDSLRGEWRRLADLKQNKLVDPRITYVVRPGTLQDNFATLFDLSATERDSLQRAIDQANERLADLERQNATISRDEKGIVTIEVRPFAKAGGAIYDDLMRTFADVLGPERYRAFATLGSEQVERTLANFGAQRRTLRVSYLPSREATPYVVRDDFEMGPRERNATTITFLRHDEAATRLGTVARLFPPELGGEK